MKSGNGSNKRALTLKLKQNSLFHALAKQADENAKRDAEDALRRKRETQNVIRKTLESQQEQKRLARRRKRWSRGCWTTNRDEPQKSWTKRGCKRKREATT